MNCLMFGHGNDGDDATSVINGSVPWVSRSSLVEGIINTICCVMCDASPESLGVPIIIIIIRSKPRHDEC